jgi:hypothetical protein
MYQDFFHRHRAKPLTHDVSKEHCIRLQVKKESHEETDEM